MKTEADKTFKVMEWLEKMKDAEYKELQENPQLFFKRMKESGEKLERWLKSADKLSKHIWV